MLECKEHALFYNIYAMNVFEDAFFVILGPPLRTRSRRPARMDCGCFKQKFCIKPIFNAQIYTFIAVCKVLDQIICIWMQTSVNKVLTLSSWDCPKSPKFPSKGPSRRPWTVGRFPQSLYSRFSQKVILLGHGGSPRLAIWAGRWMKLSVHNFVELSRCLKTIQNELGKDPYLGDSVPHSIGLGSWGLEGTLIPPIKIGSIIGSIHHQHAQRLSCSKY